MLNCSPGMTLSTTVTIGIVMSAVLLVIIIFTLGYLCGFFSQKCKRSSNLGLNKTLTQRSALGVSTTDKSISNGDDPLDLEMLENVAYGPLPARNA